MNESRSVAGGRILKSAPAIYIPSYAPATPPVPAVIKHSKQNLLPDDDVNMSNNDDDSKWWRMFLTPAPMTALNDAGEDEIKFAKLSRHFWATMFLLHRSWTAVEKNDIFEQCVGGLPRRERGRLKFRLHDALFETEKALCRTVQRFSKL